LIHSTNGSSRSDVIIVIGIGIGIGIGIII
jgi:hypothetical protein